MIDPNRPSYQDAQFSEPMPLDMAARMAARSDVHDGLMGELGTDIVEELLSLPKGYSIIEAQHDAWARYSIGHEKWAKIAKICVEFFEGQQWTPEELAVLAAEGRPETTKNKIAPLIRLLLGFFRQNRYDIKFLPGNDGTGTQEIADIITAVAKQIAERNSTNWNDAQVFQDGLFTGRGFWDLRLDFARNRLGEVKEIVLDPFAFYIDNEADSYDPNGTGGQSSWKGMIYNRWMSITEIFMLYGKIPSAELSGSLPSMPIGNDYFRTAMGFDVSPERWFGLENWLFNDFEAGLRAGGNITDHINRQRKLVRVLDRQYKQLKKCHFFVDLETGQEKIIPEDTPVEKIQRIMQWAQARQLPLQIGTDYKEVIRWTVTAGDRVLHDKWSPYDNYTVVPYFPYFRRGKTKSPIEDLLDPQREINKRGSAFLHIIMSTANSGWMWEEGALESEMERILEDEGSRPGIHIKYNEGYDAPKRIEPAATPVGMKKLEDDANRDIKEIAGINDSALGQLDRVQSGVAVQARQKQAIMGAEPYFDNFSFSRELKGRQIKAIVQQYYTEPRLIRTRRGDGTSLEHQINVRNAAGEIENNVTMGDYDLAIDESPMSATFQQGQFEDAIRLRSDLGIPVPDDIMVELSSVPRKEEIKQRMMEQRTVEQQNAQLALLATKSQLGIPPEMPPPPIVTDGAPMVMDMSKMNPAAGGAPAPAAPAPGAPMAPPPPLPGMSPSPVANPLAQMVAGRPQPPVRR